MTYPLTPLRKLRPRQLVIQFAYKPADPMVFEPRAALRAWVACPGCAAMCFEQFGHGAGIGLDLLP